MINEMGVRHAIENQGKATLVRSRTLVCLRASVDPGPGDTRCGADDFWADCARIERACRESLHRPYADLFSRETADLRTHRTGAGWPAPVLPETEIIHRGGPCWSESTGPGAAMDCGDGNC